MLLKSYKELEFEFEGLTLYPMTDDVYEDGGFYRNLVADQEGNKYHAYYTQGDADNDSWDNPYKLISL